MQRVVFLVDMNAFFISCEMTRRPELAGKPAAVSGDPKKRTGIILAANYEARKYGVKTAMVLHQALKLCPDMLLVPPDHYFYELKSQQVMNLLSCYTPCVEQNSIDEAWLDMTGTEGLFGKPLDAAKRIMDEIQNKLGLWCSIGIAENKFLAKMASEMKKPLGITELWGQDVPVKLWPLPIGAMYGIGNKTAEKLNNIGINTIGQLAKFDRKYIIKILGKSGNEIYLHANGYDDSPITPHSTGDMKSIGRSTTLPENITDLEKAKRILLELADDVGRSARKHDRKGRTVHITLKYSDFEVVTRQTTIAATFTTNEIYQAGYDLLIHNWNSFRPVRLIGISLSGFDENCLTDQISLFNYMGVEKKTSKHEQIDKAMDIIRNKYGTDKVNRAVLVNKTAKRLNNLENPS